MPERRKIDRRDFSDYMRMMNERTGELIGHLSDISTGGFKLESAHPIMENLDFLIRMDFVHDVSDKDYLVFAARSRWCQRHPIDPLLYNVGFQLIDISPEDLNIFIRIFEKFGNSNKKKNMGYIWR